MGLGTREGPSGKMKEAGSVVNPDVYEDLSVGMWGMLAPRVMFRFEQDCWTQHWCFRRAHLEQKAGQNRSV